MISEISFTVNLEPANNKVNDNDNVVPVYLAMIVDNFTSIKSLDTYNKLVMMCWATRYDYCLLKKFREGRG